MKKIISAAFALLFLNQSYVCMNDLPDWWEIETIGDRNLLAMQSYEYLSKAAITSAMKNNQEALNHFYLKYCESLSSYVELMGKRVTTSIYELQNVQLLLPTWLPDTIKFIDFITDRESLLGNNELRYLSSTNPVGNTFETLIRIKVSLKKGFDDFINEQYENLKMEEEQEELNEKLEELFERLKNLY